MKLIGLTGGIGCGKSTVGEMLKARGLPVIDADDLARMAVAKGTAGLAAISEAFGPDLLTETGGLDRAKMGALVFGDSAARQRLNAIVHPEVARLAREAFAQHSADGAAVVVYEVPLLFENNLDSAMSCTLVVRVDPEVQLARLMARDNLDEAGAKARIGAQMPLSEKVARATFVIDNGGDRAATEAQLEEIFGALTS